MCILAVLFRGIAHDRGPDHSPDTKNDKGGLPRQRPDRLSLRRQKSATDLGLCGRPRRGAEIQAIVSAGA